MTRDELRAMIDLGSRLLAVGEPGVLSTLFSSSGSTYRPLGSMMVSGPGSLVAGGISGGCLEEFIARTGRALTHLHDAAMLSFDSDAEDGRPLLGCGGAIEVLVERLTADHLHFLQQFAVAAEQDSPSTAACIIDEGNLPCVSTERFWFTQHTHFLADRRLQRLREQSMQSGRSAGCLIDSDRRGLIQLISALHRLVIFGAGNDAQPLCTLAHSLGWHVTVADRRSKLATNQRFPQADNVIAAPWADAIAQVRFTPHTAVVLMTHSVADDIEILGHLGDRPMAYLGALGPEHRRQWLLDGLAQVNGSASMATTLRGPIGLNLGDRSAAGIAVSIMSEILAVMHGRAPLPLSQPGNLDTDIYTHAPVMDA
jgi:xanthine/CO dehydrogenase XdhC/CoxF family maturation factor